MNDETRDNRIEEGDADDVPEHAASQTETPDTKNAAEPDSKDSKPEGQDSKPEGQDAEERDPEQIQVLPLVALRDTVIFPEMIVPLQVGRERSVKALDRAVRASQPVALITQRSNETEEVNAVDELYPLGTLAKIAQVIRLQDGTIRPHASRRRSGSRPAGRASRRASARRAPGRPRGACGRPRRGPCTRG